MFETTDGRIGMDPIETEESDIVAVLHGGRVSYIPRKDGENFRFVGTCFVFDIRRGEAVADVGQNQERTFTII